MRATRGRRARHATAIALAAVFGGCALLPRELNLSPLWFHRLDEHGDPLEWDLLWPIFHYEQTAAGGDDFRIRPLYRRVTEPARQAVEHQFLWPFGRVRTDAEESSQRLFPLWSWRQRETVEGERDTDWYLLFPFFWGGSNDRGDENYFAFLPFYADIPQFLTYDRFRTFLFPLFVRLDKGGHRHTLLLWPLIGFSSCAEGNHQWLRFLPFYAHDLEPGRYARHYLFWPFLSWSSENEDTRDGDHDASATTFWLWPLFGVRTGRNVTGWTFLWPLFEKSKLEDRFDKLNLFWPFFHYYKSELDSEDHVEQWWLWPLVGHARSDDQDSWSFLWPLIYWREYNDPDELVRQQWVLPFFWHINQHNKKDGGDRDFVKLWPLLHRTVQRDADGRHLAGDWSLPSPFPWRDGNAYGVEEAYGFLWELIAGRRRAADDDSVDVAARLFTLRERKGHTTASVPFLCSYEGDDGGGTLRLFQFLPLPFFGGSRSEGRQ